MVKEIFLIAIWFLCGLPIPLFTLYLLRRYLRIRHFLDFRTAAILALFIGIGEGIGALVWWFSEIDRFLFPIFLTIPILSLYYSLVLYLFSRLQKILSTFYFLLMGGLLVIFTLVLIRVNLPIIDLPVFRGGLLILLLLHPFLLLDHLSRKRKIFNLTFGKRGQ